MEKRKVFVSVPMSGKDDALIKREIQLAKRAYLKIKNLKAKDVDFYDNFTVCEHDGLRLEADSECVHKGIGYLGVAFLGLSTCEEAVFGKGWAQARGCMLERMACVLYGIPVVEE